MPITEISSRILKLSKVEETGGGRENNSNRIIIYSVEIVVRTIFFTDGTFPTVSFLLPAQFSICIDVNL